MQRIFGNIETGLILKDISFEVKSGQVLAILGSKGSGKRALLDVISRRAHGATRGQIIFQGSPLTLNVFQRNCAYVTHRSDLIPSLTVQQTLYYAANLCPTDKVSSSAYARSSRVRQLVGELGLNQVSNHSVASLNTSQYRRLVIGVELVKEPVLILLDEPASGLDPLSTYLIISMLSSYARRKGRAVILTMEKPRSDVFPFLDRAAFLCLGDILYTGPTRLMLDYFTSIGFPCPRMENPLMYYLCLSTVDRRSRERFLESNAQIQELVDKFKVEGSAYVAAGGGGTAANTPIPPPSIAPPPSFSAGHFDAVKPSPFLIFFTLYSHVSLRLGLFPLYSLLIFLMFFNSQVPEHAMVNRYGILLFSIWGAYLMSIITTAYTFGAFRTRYYQEAQADTYSGPLFLISYLLFSLPFSLATVAAGSRIIFQVSGLNGSSDWIVFGGVLWACYLVGEHQTIAILMVVRSQFKAVVSSAYLSVIYFVLASGILRSYAGLPEWLLYLSYGSQAHYAGAALSHRLLGAVPSPTSSSMIGCRYAENSHHFAQRYHATASSSVDYNLCLALAFPAIFALANCLLYIMPLPSFVKAKFRE
ncbi:hypothetical protein AAG570_013805 [Ranatra chinensis]|uniref:ABC transporter domain-containing protein n=1 Tax=Ranatra chinensis TaxID=642074 RepID=A0ABD0YDI5_9HEMI